METEKVLSGFHKRSIVAMAFSFEDKFKDPRLLASIGADDDHTIAVHDWKNDTLIASCKGEKQSVLALRFVAPTTMVQCGVNHVRFWDMRGRNLVPKKASLKAKSNGKKKSNGGIEGVIQPYLCLCSLDSEGENDIVLAGSVDGCIYAFSSRDKRLIHWTPAHCKKFENGIEKPFIGYPISFAEEPSKEVKMKTNDFFDNGDVKHFLSRTRKGRNGRRKKKESVTFQKFAVNTLCSFAGKVLSGGSDGRIVIWNVEDTNGSFQLEFHKALLLWGPESSRLKMPVTTNKKGGCYEIMSLDVCEVHKDPYVVVGTRGSEIYELKVPSIKTKTEGNNGSEEENDNEGAKEDEDATKSSLTDNLRKLKALKERRLSIPEGYPSGTGGSNNDAENIRSVRKTISKIRGRSILHHGYPLVQGHFRHETWGLAMHPAKENVFITVGDDKFLRIWNSTEKKLQIASSLKEWLAHAQYLTQIDTRRSQNLLPSASEGLSEGARVKRMAASSFMTMKPAHQRMLVRLCLMSPRERRCLLSSAIIITWCAVIA